MSDIRYEDELPVDITDQQYDAWFKSSYVVDGVRMGAWPNAGGKENWIQTYTGIKFHPLNPEFQKICIEDIAHSLSMQCRFNGHTRAFYSVAEHCCHVSDQLPDKLKLAGLLHDASEAYLCDLPKPLKDLSQLSQYRVIERELEFMIEAKFRVIIDNPEIKMADSTMLCTEARQLLNPVHPDWPLPYESYPIELKCWNPAEAKAEYIKRFEALHGGNLDAGQ